MKRISFLLDDEIYNKLRSLFPVSNFTLILRYIITYYLHKECKKDED